jgi:hypothetical protein
MTLFILAIVAFLIALVLVRLISHSNSFTSSARTTKDRRSGRERRQRRVPVRRERRKRPRRRDDIASQFVASLNV